MKPISISSLVQFQTPWPPAQPICLHSQTTEGVAIKLIGLIDGHLQLVVEHRGGAKDIRAYQKVHVSHSGVAILVIVISDDEVSLYINGEALLPNHIGKEELREIEVAPGPIGSSMRYAFPALQRISDVDDSLFISTLIDIHRKVTTGEKYEILRASGLLRQVFLDGRPLLNIVNRTYQKQLQFRVIKLRFDPFEGLNVKFVWRTIDPSLVPSADSVEVGVDGFLSTVCLRIEDTTYSVRDVIKTCANVKGGVHSRHPNPGKEADLIALDDANKLFDQELSIAAVCSIVSVALSGLEPLVGAIQLAANIDSDQPS